jgi:hypothetical protein
MLCDSLFHPLISAEHYAGSSETFVSDGKACCMGWTAIWVVEVGGEGLGPRQILIVMVVHVVILDERRIALHTGNRSRRVVVIVIIVKKSPVLRFRNWHDFIFEYPQGVKGVVRS